MSLNEGVGYFLELGEAPEILEILYGVQRLQG
jgi:hypothetical protein